jgi:hypothetical protein
MAIEMSNPLVEKKFTLMFQMEGVKIFTPPTNSIEGPNRSTNNLSSSFIA